jgi:hypothetical protein
MNIFASSKGSDPVRDHGVHWACFYGAWTNSMYPNDLKIERERIDASISNTSAKMQNKPNSNM